MLQLLLTVWVFSSQIDQRQAFPYTILGLIILHNPSDSVFRAKYSTIACCWFLSAYEDYERVFFFYVIAENVYRDLS